MRPQISRADLLDCLREHGEDQLDGLAAAFGYVGRSGDMTRKDHRPGSDESFPESAKSTDEILVSRVPVQGRQSDAVFHRVVARRQLDPTGAIREEPDWFRRACPFRSDDPDIRAPSDVKPPSQQALIRWPRLWPFLKLLLGAMHETRSPDVHRIADQLAQGRVPRRLPYQRHRGWAPRCRIIIDYAEPLVPFWADFNDLQQRLRALRGQLGLTVLALPDGEPEGRWWQQTADGWRELADGCPTPGAGQPLLVLSDLGCIDRTDLRRRRWRRYGRRLRRAGCAPVALMPCPVRWWDAGLCRLFHPVCWDRATRLPGRSTPSSKPAIPIAPTGRDTDGDKLLNLLAPAVRMEPALLRDVRYLLPVRGGDVGSEAAAWNHSRIHRTPLACYFDAGAVAGYRKAFAREPSALRQRVGERLHAHHASLSPAIAYEERLVLGDLGVTPDPQARSFIERLVKTLHDSGNDLTGSARAWVRRMAERQHAAMWRNDVLASAWMSVHLPELRDGEALAVPEGLELEQVGWLLGQGREAVYYALRQRGESLYLEADGSTREDTDLDAPGSPLAGIRATAPYVRIRWSHDDQSADGARMLPIDQPIALLPAGRLEIRTDQQELTIDCIRRPEWAEGIGRDERGLFVTWLEEQRCAYWTQPGEYPVFGRTGKRLGRLEFANGFWQDEADALIRQRDGLWQPEWADECGFDRYGLYAGFTVGGVRQRLRWMLPGGVRMGSPESEAERKDDETLHRVILSRGFWLADTACTQALWQAVMGDNPSHFKGAERPVEQVSWDDIQQFLDRLNTRVPSGGFRLPSEAEWEYACRAGHGTAFWFGEQITPKQVNYDGDHPYADGRKGLNRKKTVKVKALPCNDRGLYQMHGNVWEWCRDGYGGYPAGSVADPEGPTEGKARVLRGGGWFGGGGFARSARRYSDDPGDRIPGVGFRLCNWKP